ncbi:response regulator, partial [Bacteroidota bacterium]
VIFYVKDTGIGLEEEEKNVIFNRFSKIENDKTRLFRGAGLGLAICKNLVELLGGKIGVDSVKDKGSTFYFTIPCTKNLKKEILIGESESMNLNFVWPNKTVLIAEDEESSFHYIEMILSDSQIRILRAKDGKESIEICRKENIDLVLMDIKMPEIDGLEATEIIKQEFENIKIIALTAFALEADEKTCLQAGCDAYITKPIQKYKLLNLIDKHI